MSIIKAILLQNKKEKTLRENIAETKRAIERLEILTLELERADIAMKDHEKLFGMVIMDLDYPFWIKDCNSRFMLINNACIEQILKTTPDKVALLTDEDFENDALSKVCMITDKIVIVEERTYRGIEHARYADGTDLWIDATKSRLIMSGEMVGTCGFAKNITDAIPDDVKEEHNAPGYVEIPEDLLYNPCDIEDLLKNEVVV